MAQVRFYPTDLRRKSASHTLLMAQVPPLKTDLLHSSHPPAPFTLQACTALPHPPAPFTLLTCSIHPTHLRHSPYRPAPLYPTHLHQRPHCPARRHHQAQNSAAAHSQVRRLLSHGTAPSQNTARGAGERLPSGNRPRSRSPTPQVPVIVIPRAKPECISCLSNPADGCSSPRERGERPPCGVVNTWPVGPRRCNSFGISRLPA